MKTNALFRECLAQVDSETRARFEISYAIADKIDSILRERHMTQHDLAVRTGKRESEISKWLTGRHNFTMATIAKIENALGVKIITVA